MAVLTTTCPHCGADPVPLTVHAYRKRDDHTVYVFTTCPKCLFPTSVLLSKDVDAKATSEWFLQSAAKENIDVIEMSGWRLLLTFPTETSNRVPEHTPPDIARVFRQAKAMHRRNELDGAAILYGKVIDIATKAIDSSIVGGLAARIDKLAEAGKLPTEVRAWAHEIRIMRNDAAHTAEEPKKTDVDEIGEFAEAFLEYVFTLPTKFKNRQSRKLNEMLQ